MREITIKIEVDDETLTSDLEQIIEETLNENGVEAIYEIIE